MNSNYNRLLPMCQLLLIFTLGPIISCTNSFSANNSYRIDGDGMAPTYIEGEEISFQPSSDLKRGDVIIFFDPRNKDRVLIKRILGLPLEKVETKAERVFIGGREVKSQEISAEQCTKLKAKLVGHSKAIRTTCLYELADKHKYPILRSEDAEILNESSRPIDLLRDTYFVIGDNRAGSIDSRSFGPVKRSLILGKVVAGKSN